MKRLGKARKPLSILFALVLVSSLWPAPPVAAVAPDEPDPAAAMAETAGPGQAGKAAEDATDVAQGADADEIARKDGVATDGAQGVGVPSDVPSSDAGRDGVDESGAVGADDSVAPVEDTSGVGAVAPPADKVTLPLKPSATESEGEGGDARGLAFDLEENWAPLSSSGIGLTPQAMVIPSGDPTAFAYTGDAQTYTAPGEGYYQLEVWGAQGGSGGPYENNGGGKGGYSTGVVRLADGETVWVYVGGQGQGGNTPVEPNPGGFNGGGASAGAGTQEGWPQGGGGGGGASDIRVGADSLFNRVIVAGGGGGGISFKANGDGRRGSGWGQGGGGATGLPGYGYSNNGGEKWTTNGGGTQTRGGIAATGTFTYPGQDGSFGLGGDGGGLSASPGGGGGGGWYGGAGGGGGIAGTPGGGSASTKACSGSGGSGFVWTGQSLTLPEGGEWGVDADHALVEARTSQNVRNGAGRAVVTRLKWAVSFSANGGEGGRDSVELYVDEIKNDCFAVEYIVPNSTPEDCGFTREGYTFAGWAKTPAGADTRDTQVTIDTNTTLYAQWEPNVYALTLSAPDATSTTHTTSLYEKFDTGFYASSGCEGNPVSNVTAPERVCTVTYASGTTDTNVVLPRSSDKADATFLGYFSEPQGAGDQLIDGEGALTDALASNRYLEAATAHAAWEPGKVELPAPTRTGYDFAGWYVGDTRVGGAGDEFTATELATTLVARWAPKVFEITLDNADATTDGTTSVFLKYDVGVFADAACTMPATSITRPQRTYSVTYNTEGKGTLPPEQQNPVTVIWEFAGYVTPDGGTLPLVDASGNVTSAFGGRSFSSNATLHATWTPGSTELPNPTPSGTELSFLGWSTDADAHAGMSAGANYTPTEEDVTLHALWASIWYKVAYTGLDGVVGFNPPDAIDLGTSEEPLNAEFTVEHPFRPGWEFTGWNISDMTDQTHRIGGVETTDTSRERVTETSFARLQVTDGATVNFQATWSPITVEVKLDNQGATMPGSTAVWQAYGQNVYKSHEGAAYDDPMGTGEGGANPIDKPQKRYTLTYDVGEASSSAAAPASGSAESAFGGYFTEKDGAGQQLILATGHRGELFSNTFYRQGAETPTLFAKWSPATVELADYVSRAPGLRFVGWSDSEAATSVDHLPGDVIELSGNKTVYAVYDEPTYDVSYHANGGEGAPEAQVKLHNVDLELSDQVPTRADTEGVGATLMFDANGGESTGAPNKRIVGVIESSWAFGSWNTHQDGSGDSYDASDPYEANESATLHAQWIEAPVRREVTLPTPTYAGYHCEGWFTAPVGGDKVGDAGQTVEQPAEDVQLFAHWSALKYHVDFYDGAEFLESEEFVYDADEKQLLSAEELGLSRDGWLFVGWRAGEELAVDYTDGQSVRNLSTSTGTIELHAVWERDVYFISADAGLLGQGTLSGHTERGLAPAEDEGTIQSVSQLSDRSSYQSIVAPALGEVDGWRSLGWLASEVAASTPDVDAGATFAPQLADTFYGLYSRDVTLGFDGGGADSGSVESLEDVQRMNASGRLTPITFVLPANGFVREGWRFAGWDLGRSGDAVTVKPAALESADLVAQAEWMGPFEYAIAFDANGGEGAMGVQVMPEHVTRALSANAFTREGYAFVGWNTTADGSGTAYTDAAEVVDLAEPGETVTLFAQWELVPGPDPAVDPAPRESPSGAAAGTTPATGDVASRRAALLGVLGVAGLALALGMRLRRRRG